MIALDLSRLLSRATKPTPTGIDRVELAYARHLAASGRPHCFGAATGLGGLGLLPARAAECFIASLAALWRDGGSSTQRLRIAVLAWRLRLAAALGARALRQALCGSDAPVYLLVSHKNLDRARPIARLKATTGARFICLIHDLIPLDFPLLARPNQRRKHHRRIATTAALADAVIVNSRATRDSLVARLGHGAARLQIVIAPLGGDLPRAAPPALADRAYFVCISTLEIRKNHRLLLDVWERLARVLGARAPGLRLIGRHGYGRRRAIAGLAGLGGLVSTHAGLPDAAMAKMLRGARALLYPSLAEGFGLPVIEALAQGVPVLCSDLPALRESGNGIPDYIDPADTDAWHRAVLDYAADTPRRRSQLARLATWQPPASWDDHFVIVERLLH